MSYDPSDKGRDAAALCYRDGSVILDMQERADLDVNEACDWALDYAIKVQADYFIWDGDGPGASLLRQRIVDALKGKKIEHLEFRGSKGVDNPNQTYQPVDSHSNVKEKKNKDVFQNRRAQHYMKMRDAFRKAHEAVQKGVDHDPDELLSLSSDIPSLAELRASVSRIPLQTNDAGLIQIMSKEEMARQNPPIVSPSMAEALMMSFAVAVRHQRPSSVSFSEGCERVSQ